MYYQMNLFSLINIAENNAVKEAYRIMQNQYVLRDSDRIEFNEAVSKIKEIKNMLEENSAWKKYNL